MPREFGAVNVTIWQDADFRDLPVLAQHLYLLLWTHPDLSYCGIVDYRPGRLAKFVGWSDSAMIEAAAHCLEARHFLVIDRESEEALIRSWIRWDGLMKQPRLAVSMSKAYASTASNLLRGVVVDELHKIRNRSPELPCWSHEKVADVLAQPRVSAKSQPTPSDPFGPEFGQDFGQWFGQRLAQTSPDVSVVVSVPPTPAPAPSPLLPAESDDPAQTSASRKRSAKATRLPADWHPSDELIASMQQQRPDVDQTAEISKFVDYWIAKSGKDATKLNWDATYRNWIRNARSSGGTIHQLQPRSNDDVEVEVDRRMRYHLGNPPDDVIENGTEKQWRNAQRDRFRQQLLQERTS